MDAAAPDSLGFAQIASLGIGPAMQRYLDDGLFAGTSTLVARHGSIVHQEQVGLADLETNTPMKADALFRVYSMTKPIAATVLMTLHEEGRFQLFDPIHKYLPSFEDVQVLEGDEVGNQRLVAPKRSPTVHDLLKHTAGFTYHFLEGTPVAEMYADAEIIMGHQLLADTVAELATGSSCQLKTMHALHRCCSTGDNSVASACWVA